MCVQYFCWQFYRTVKKLADGVNDTTMEYLFTSTEVDRTEYNEIVDIADDDLVSSEYVLGNSR